jgi:DNA-dependent RNA polymerase auxiliary subunit epsilon
LSGYFVGFKSRPRPQSSGIFAKKSCNPLFQNDVDHSFSHAQEVYCYSALVEDFQNSLKNKPYHQILSKEYFNLDYIDTLVDEYILFPKDISVANLTKLVPIIMLCYVGWYARQ